MSAETLFNELYNVHAAGILRLCRSYAQDEAIANDLFQETFLHVWRGLSKFRNESKPSTWLYRIAINTCLSHVRSENRKRSNAMELGRVPEEFANPWQDENQKKLFAAIHALPDADRLIISLFLDELPYSQIAEISGISENNLRVKIHRIKQQLTKLFFKDE